MFCCALLSHQCLQLSLYFPTYLPTYETYLLQNWLRWNQILTQLRFIHNWVIMGIQWMVRCWVLVRCGQVNRSVNIDTRYLPTYFFIFLGRQVNLIGPLLPKNETMEAPQKKRLCFDVHSSSVQPTYIGERRTTFAKAYGIKVRCLYGEHAREHIENSLGT